MVIGQVCQWGGVVVRVCLCVCREGLKDRGAGVQVLGSTVSSNLCHELVLNVIVCARVFVHTGGGI